jgi:polysaccharide export outer membrane protein
MMLLAQGAVAQVAPVICVGVGDVVQVSIFEASGAGEQSGNYVTLPSQSIDARGTFAVPFAGDIKAAGRSLPEIRREIEAKLAKRAIEPRVDIALVKQNSTGQCLP